MTMREDEQAAVAEQLTMVAAVLGVELTDVQLKGYLLALRDLSGAAVLAACERATRECTFFPKPAELRTLAGDGAPDVGLVEGLIVAHLRKPGVVPKAPTDPFLALVCERLGGMRAVVDMPSGVRIAALAKVVPGVVQAARLRGLALPAPDTRLPAIASRAVEQPALAGPVNDPRDRSVPPALAALITGVVRTARYSHTEPVGDGADEEG